MKSLIKLAAIAGLACLLLAAIVVVTPVSAEISAETDGDGNYVRMIYLTNASSKHLRIWSTRFAGRNMTDGLNQDGASSNLRGWAARSVGLSTIHPLNPSGDALMDSWPYYTEDRFDSNRPYVVWSRFNGDDLDLVWTRWQDGDWAPVDWVERIAQPGMEQNPYPVSHPVDGRPHLVWWSDEDGTGRVYLSIFLESRWMDRFLVSDLDTDSRYPVIEFLESSRIQVTYDTTDGPMSRVIMFNSPQTITDDIDPMTIFSREELKGTDLNF